MSIKVMSYVWEHAPQKGSELVMLLAIADNADDFGAAWPATDTLAKKVRIDRRWALRMLNKLASEDALMIFNRFREDNPNENLSNIYVIPMEGVQVRLPQVKGTVVQRQVPEATGGVVSRPRGSGAQTTPPSGAQTTGGVVPRPPESSFNRQSDPPDNRQEKQIPPDGDADVFDDFNGEPQQLYPVNDKDIASMIAAWWNWVPKQPIKNGAVVKEGSQYAIPANRETATNLMRRGIMPADMISFLAEIRTEPDSRWAYLRVKPMTFVYAAACIEDWVIAERAVNWYTPDAPRIVARKPGKVINMSDVDGLTADEINQQFPDLLADVPPVYISPQRAAEIEAGVPTP